MGCVGEAVQAQRQRAGSRLQYHELDIVRPHRAAPHGMVSRHERPSLVLAPPGQASRLSASISRPCASETRLWPGGGRRTLALAWSLQILAGVHSMRWLGFGGLADPQRARIGAMALIFPHRGVALARAAGAQLGPISYAVTSATRDRGK
jgi:hypothetical protein